MFLYQYIHSHLLQMIIVALRIPFVLVSYPTLSPHQRVTYNFSVQVLPGLEPAHPQSDGVKSLPLSQPKNR